MAHILDYIRETKPHTSGDENACFLQHQFGVHLSPAPSIDLELLSEAELIDNAMLDSVSCSSLSSDALTSAIRIECRSLSGQVLEVALANGASTAELREAIGIDQTTKLFCNGAMLADEEILCPSPGEKQLVVHAVPFVCFDGDGAEARAGPSISREESATKRSACVLQGYAWTLVWSLTLLFLLVVAAYSPGATRFAKPEQELYATLPVGECLNKSSNASSQANTLLTEVALLGSDGRILPTDLRLSGQMGIKDQYTALGDTIGKNEVAMPHVLSLS